MTDHAETPAHARCRRPACGREAACGRDPCPLRLSDCIGFDIGCADLPAMIEAMIDRIGEGRRR